MAVKQLESDHSDGMQEYEFDRKRQLSMQKQFRPTCLTGVQYYLHEATAEDACHLKTG